MTLGEAVRAAAAKLRAAGVETPDLDARVLAAEAFGLDRAALLARGGDRPDAGRRSRFDALVERRLSREPVARILGRREFWGLSFALAPETLVPRPDTETVVEAALSVVEPVTGAPTILDIGTGSGCILLALLSELRNATGVGVDRAAGAAAAARRNAERLGLEDRAAFAVADWGGAISGRFDLIVSNPPYVSRRDLDALDADVREHDPRLALDGGPEGLDAYRAILRDAPRLLGPRGAVVLELGIGQGDDVAGIAAQHGLAVSDVRRDLSGVARALVLEASRADVVGRGQKSLGIR